MTKPRFFRLTLIAGFLCFLVPLGRCHGQGALQKSQYSPLEIGNTWHYKVGNKKVVVRVAAHEKVGDVLCARLESTLDGKTKVEHVAVQADGIYRYQANKKKLDPPLCILKLPAKAGDSWMVNSTIGETKASGKFKLTEEEVEVPAGKYKTMKATSHGFKIGTRPLTIIYWYTPGTGIVKQQLTIAGVEVVLELEQFQPAGKTD